MDTRQQKISGTTRQFSGFGRRLGYATANVSSGTKLADGVYFGFANLGPYKRHPCMIFIGTPTTVGDTDRRVEAHLLDIPDKNYYRQQLELEVIYYHRANKKFTNIDQLKEAMQKDEVAAREWFRQRSDG